MTAYAQYMKLLLHEISQTIKGAIYVWFNNIYTEDLYELLHNKLGLGIIFVAIIVLGVYAIYDWRNYKKAMKKYY
jgi:uncharacterized membrane protein